MIPGMTITIQVPYELEHNVSIRTRTDHSLSIEWYCGVNIKMDGTVEYWDK